MLKDWLSHPHTRSLDIDDPRTTELRRQIIQQKSFLRQIYQEWYESIAASLPPGDEPVLELGAGAGYLREYIPDLIASDILACQGLDAVLDSSLLPFAPGTLRGIVMIDALHHFSKPRHFLVEAARCVRPKGMIAMIEPWVTPWSRIIYGRMHHEPFRPEVAEWEFPSKGPLSGANIALPWIIFVRDRAQFEQEFPQWQIQRIKPIMPFRYLFSGGVSLRSFMPGWSFRFWRRVETKLSPWENKLAMFAQIILVRIGG